MGPGGVRPARRLAFLGHIVFRVEGGLVAHRMRWPLAKELRRQVDVECSGPGCRDAMEILELMRGDIPRLNEGEGRCDGSASGLRPLRGSKATFVQLPARECLPIRSNKHSSRGIEYPGLTLSGGLELTLRGRSPKVISSPCPQPPVGGTDTFVAAQSVNSMCLSKTMAPFSLRTILYPRSPSPNSSKLYSPSAPL